MNAESQLAMASLLRSSRIASMGTLRDGGPMVSMVPFLVADDFSAFYIHISGLALHTQNLIVDLRTSLLITESSDSDVDPQTLARISIQGNAEMIELRSNQYSRLRSEYLAKFPKAELNFELGDFRLVAIRPAAGRFVEGFGRIHDLVLDDFIRAAHSGS